MELLDYFRGVRPWSQLIRFLDRIQEIPNSCFVTAQANDDESALVAARRRRDSLGQGNPLRYRPPAVQWDTHAVIQAAMLDRLGEIEALLEALPVATDKKGKPRKRNKPPKPFARPETAVERAEQFLAEEHMADIISDVESSYVTAEEYARMTSDPAA